MSHDNFPQPGPDSNPEQRSSRRKNITRCTAAMGAVAAVMSFAFLKDSHNSNNEAVPTVSAPLAPPISTETSTTRPPIAVTGAPSPEAPTVTPSPSQTPEVPTALVCDVISAQKVQGQMLVDVRPVMDTSGFPMDVQVTPSPSDSKSTSIYIVGRDHTTDPVAFYNLDGKAIDLDGQPMKDKEDIAMTPLKLVASSLCHTSELYGRQLSNDRQQWEATTNPDAAPPRDWAPKELKPDTFGGVGLNEGFMPQSHLNEILVQAQRDAQPASPPLFSSTS